MSLRNLRPDLVIIHRSAYFHTLNAEKQYGKKPLFEHPADDPKWVDLYREADKWLIDFLGFVGTLPHTRFLVYSRGTGPKWKGTEIQEWLVPEYREEWKREIETAYPDLKGHITTMVIETIKGGPPPPPPPSFSDAGTKKVLRNHVRNILNLPGKPE